MNVTSKDKVHNEMRLREMLRIIRGEKSDKKARGQVPGRDRSVV